MDFFKKLLNKEAITRNIKNFLRDKYNIAFLLILIVAIILRIKYLFVESIWPDEALYAWFSDQLLKDFSFIFNKEFAVAVVYFPVFLVTFFDLFLSNFIAAKIVPFLFSIAGIILIYKLGEELGNKFIGLLAAIMLSFHHLHWFFSDRILFDVPLTTMYTLTALMLIKYDKNKTVFWAVMLAISAALTFYTKLAGALVIPFIGIYFILTYRLKIISLLKRKEVWIASFVFLILMSLYLIVTLSQFSSITTAPRESLITATKESADFSRPFSDFSNLVLPYILPIFLIGLVFILVYRQKRDFLLLSWFIGYFVLFVITHPQTVPRYLLPVIPMVFLTSAIALSELIIYIKKLTDFNLNRWIFVIITLFLIIPFYSQGSKLIEDKSNSYIGLKETGEWIEDNVEKSATVYVTSVRAIRLYSGREAAYEEGKIYYLGKMSKEEFESQINQYEKPIYLEIDIWESYQPDWTRTEDTLKYLIGLNFFPVYSVEKELQTNDGKTKSTVAMIFKKEI